MTGSSAPAHPGRFRILMGAYAAGPVDEPEAAAGWAFSVAAAVNHDVWLITRTRFRPSIEAALAEDPELAAHLNVTYLDLSAQVMKRKKRSIDLYWYYALWQRKLTGVARALNREIEFDCAHHITFANDWLPCGLTGLSEVPLIWGPVGGSSSLPIWRLRTWLGWRGTVTEVVRAIGTWLPRRIWGDRTAGRAAIVVAQNADVARRFASAAHVVVEANACLDPVDPEHSAREVGDGQHRTAVFVGRLLAWKGGRLALDALARPSMSHWRLRVYGTGYEKDALIERAERLGIAERVEFLGHRPRPEILEAFRTADAMVFPSMHDQAGWVAAEASSLGCPVVCLPLGGPPLLAASNAHVSPLDGDIAGDLAATLEAAAVAGGRPDDRWSRERLPSLVDRWYRQAAGSSEGTT